MMPPRLLWAIGTTMAAIALWGYTGNVWIGLGFEGGAMMLLAIALAVENT